MAEKRGEKKRWSVRGAVVYRNLNAALALGAWAVGAMFPATAIVAYPYAALNGLQAAGGEVVRRRLQKRHKKS